MESKKIGLLMGFFLVSVTLVVDAAQLALDLLLVGEFINWVIDLSFAGSLFFIFYLGGYFNRTNSKVFLAALTLELIPIVQMFAFWSPFIWYIIWQSQKGNIAGGLNPAGRMTKRIPGTPPPLPQRSLQTPLPVPRTAPSLQKNVTVPTKANSNLLNLRNEAYNKDNVLDLTKASTNQ